MNFFITGGPVFDGRRLIPQGSVLVHHGRVVEVSCSSRSDMNVARKGSEAPGNLRTINTNGSLIMPGLVDLHSDSLERSIEKRKGVFFDVEFALLNLDRHLAACGITSFFHALSFADNELGLRSPGTAASCVKKIKAFTNSPQSLVRHNTHIRYEVGSRQSFEVILGLLDEGLVDLVSIMDHTPGQGQFKSLTDYLTFHLAEYDLTRDEIESRAREKLNGNQEAWDMVTTLVDVVSARGIPMLSHDDDTPEKVDLVRSMGVKATEFPVSMAAAVQASKAGMAVFMGSPNLIRDASTNGNLKASQVLETGMLTGLVSDYYPESLFQAAFKAGHKINNLEAGLAAVTSGPGGYLNPERGPGRLSPGAPADILIVNQDHAWAHITQAFVNGRQVFSIEAPHMSRAV
ncbi:alpha-D-ribose 1-methylphosphonate 5-triphosphate diphosphatase [Desulfobacter curvatus]|uniref:alpha-D-ribose 1-methylphosphonate 5-triphosphate diphosphatase n=1 Tax=Desulfobacter curvatus TaxID=2290 RepID=UPI00035D5A43|nr:alpha-D-ribose 1-methylphosphonate 5-triphosphate diphosphatase [Desulfobacter curvatus]